MSESGAKKKQWIKKIFTDVHFRKGDSRKKSKESKYKSILVIFYMRFFSFYYYQ